jgi:hypothetical protein
VALEPVCTARRQAGQGLCLLEILHECLGKGSLDGNKCVLFKRGSRVVAIILYAPIFWQNLGGAFVGCWGGGTLEVRS